MRTKFEPEVDTNGVRSMCVCTTIEDDYVTHMHVANLVDQGLAAFVGTLASSIIILTQSLGHVAMATIEQELLLECRTMYFDRTDHSCSPDQRSPAQICYGTRP